VTRFASAGGARPLGGDSVYSAPLGGGRALWLSGDTLLGTAGDGRRDGAVMVSNTLGLQSLRKQDAPIRFVSGRPVWSAKAVSAGTPSSW
jgi:hypothetical protein